MSKKYKVRILDDANNLLAVLENSKNERLHKLFNQANDLSFSIPSTDPKAEYIKLATKFEIWKEDIRKAAGKIIKRDTTGDVWLIQGFTNEIYLEGLQTPGNCFIDGNIGSSVFGPNVTLKGIMEALTYKYTSIVVNRAFETSDEFVIGQTDDDISFTLEDRIALEKTATGGQEELNDGIMADVYLYPVVNEGASQGRITFQLDIPVGFELHRLRWQQEVAETNEIIYSYRTSTDGGTTWSSWSSWFGTGSSQETPAREGYPLTHPSGADTIQVRLQLINEDGGSTEEPTTRTEGYDEAGNPIVIYGSTPVLDAIELVFRQNADNRIIVPHSTDWPFENTPVVYDYEFHYNQHLGAAADLCDDYGYEFYVDGNYYLHLQEQFGSDRTNEVVFRHSDNMNIQTLEDDDSELANILTCLGAGDGMNQLKIVLEDQQSIDDNGPRPDIFEDKDIDNLTDLETAGQEELNMRKDVTERFRVQGVHDEDFPEYDIGDFVTIAIPKDNILTSGRIIEMDIASSAQGENINLGINDTLASIIDSMVEKEKKFPGDETQKPPKPTGVFARGEYRKVVLGWKARGTVRIYHSDSKNGEYKLLAEGKEKYVHEPLETGTPHYYKLSHVFFGVESEKYGPIRAVTATVPGSDLDDTPPNAPNWQITPIQSDEVVTTGNTRIVRNHLFWNENSEDNILKYIIQRSEDELEWEHIASPETGINTYTDQDGLESGKEYFYRLFAVSNTGTKSAASTTESIITGSEPIPTIPSNAPTIIAGYKLTGISLPGVISDLDKRTLSAYVIQYSTCDAILDSNANTYSMPASPVWSSWADMDGGTIDSRTLTHTELDYSKGYRYRYKAVNTSGNESSWSDPSSGTVPLKSGQQDIAYRSLISEHIQVQSLKAEVYQEIRNVLPWNFLDNVDQTHPLELDFHIPSETESIVKIILSAKVIPFRAYSTGAASGGGVTETSTMGGGHTHNLWNIDINSAGSHNHGGSTGSVTSHNHSISTTTSTTSGNSGSGIASTGSTGSYGDPVGDHAHSIGGYNGAAPHGHYHDYDRASSTGSSGSHDHSLGNDGSHTHTIDAFDLVEGGSHQHSVSIPNHTHNLNFGIYEDTNLPSSIDVYGDDGTGYSLINTYSVDANGVIGSDEIILTSEFSLNSYNWKKIKFEIGDSTLRVRISGQLIAKVDLTA